ncbi:MAG: potassium/proton antiporter [Bacteroidales bacterium]|nr:potassium/proton antiporter [Bacteroidales bacterium]MBQ9174118.1 potassium/proton antiporter [Bacteroidales bacterium]MBQ9711274.1 potassium/proton antiporter [Bacteroidales bacterium]
MTPLFLILIAVVILTSIFLNTISSRIGVPTLLAFMLLGMLFANNGLWPVRFDNYEFAKETCTVALIFIMFYGGFGTRWDAIKPVVKESVLLASVGVVITAGVVGVFCHYALGWEWLESMLFGSVMSSTDAASVFSILRSKRLGLKNNTAPMLEMESGSNDPAAYMLTAVFLSAMNGTASGGSVAWSIVAQILFGAGLGVAIAYAATKCFRKMQFPTAGFDSLFIFATAIASYAIPTLVGGNGYLSAYIVGIILGNEEFRDKKSLVNFFDGLTGLMQMIIFFLLGLLARPTLMHKAILPALAIFLFMLLVARPVAVFGILTPFRKYGFKQQALISFVGLRGAASIVFAIMAMVDPAFLHNDIFNIVFVVVLLSIAFQGSLIPWAAKKLDMVDPNTDILKTFNDYTEGTGMNFGQISITGESTWAGKSIKELGLPDNVLIALVIRGDERIQPHGSTVLQKGDEIITLTRGFDDTSIFLYEKTIKKDSRRVGQRIADVPGQGLIVMIRREDKNIIPSGNTVLHAGDKIVILNLKRQS